MGKKNPFVFTIGFDKSDPDHVYVTELLNTTEKKSKTDRCGNSGIYGKNG